MKEYKGKERRELTILRKTVDGSKGPQKSALIWMARKLGPDKLAPLEHSLRESKAGMSDFDLCLSSMSKKARKILEMRGKGKTYSEIGRHFGQSGSYMRAIEFKQMRRLLFRISRGSLISETTFERHRYVFDWITDKTSKSRLYGIGFLDFSSYSKLVAYQKACAHLPRLNITELYGTESLLDVGLENLALSARAAGCLRNGGLRTIRDLVQCQARDLRKGKNFGLGSLKEVEDTLAEIGLHLGMKLDE